MVFFTNYGPLLVFSRIGFRLRGFQSCLHNLKHWSLKFLCSTSTVFWYNLIETTSSKYEYRVRRPAQPMAEGKGGHFASVFLQTCLSIEMRNRLNFFFKKKKKNLYWCRSQDARKKVNLAFNYNFQIFNVPLQLFI